MDFPFSNDNKRYHTLAYENACRGQKQYKAALDVGLSCPNLDGTKGVGGCLYCDGGSGYFTESAAVPITKQLDDELARIRAKTPGAGAVAYFQAHTNTYAPAPVLRELFTAALAHEGVCGLAVATRADCLPPDVLDLLSEFNEKTELTVELGLQTVFDDTAARINRCHAYADFRAGYAALRARNIRVTVHLIDGLPGETAERMVESARTLGWLRPDGVKLHLLHVIRGTALCALYERGDYTPLTREEYIDIVVRQLEVLPPETVIERLTGDGDRRTLVAPLWSRDKRRVLGGIDKALAERDTWQGKLFEEGDA